MARYRVVGLLRYARVPGHALEGVPEGMERLTGIGDARLSADADADDCGQRFRSKPDADSDPRRTGILMIPAGVVVDVADGVS